MLSNFPVRVSDHGYSTLPKQEVALPGWRESVILEHWSFNYNNFISFLPPYFKSNQAQNW